MLEPSFSAGDRVVHTGKPEWGIGVVSKTQRAGAAGHQLVTVRFESAGVKTLSTQHATLSPAHTPAAVSAITSVDQEAADATPARGADLAERMVSLPESVRDPFTAIESRLERTIELYRFDASARALIEWGVAQSGLRDPLAVYSRPELEQLFLRWARHRDEHLLALLGQVRRRDPEAAARHREALPPHVQRALRSSHARR
jgi:hypothetical protein